MRILWYALLFLLVACQGANATDKEPNSPNNPCQGANAADKEPNDPNNPKELLQTKWDALVSVLQNKDIDQKTKEKEVGKILTPIFDFPLMAKLALGRTHWPKFTPPQRQKFTQLFAEKLKTSYREKIMLYTDEQALFKPIVENKKTIHIPMELTSKDRKVVILYKLRKVDKRWKIYDVEIQGVSMLLTYRSQFDDILRNGTVKDLFSRLEKPPTR